VTGFFITGNLLAEEIVYHLNHIFYTMKPITVLFVLVIVVFFSCSKSSSGGGGGGGGNGTADCSTIAKSFSANVQPITSTRCAISGCHAAGSINGPGELTTYQQIFAARAQIRSAVASGVMPKGSSLTQAQINTIVCWIDAGAANN
jgi:hypothetical protein